MGRLSNGFQRYEVLFIQVCYRLMLSVLHIVIIILMGHFMFVNNCFNLLAPFVNLFMTARGNSSLKLNV